jgi:iron complex outermembrane receptor protein
MEKPMIRYVLNTLGSFRSALAVGVGLPFLIAASAFAQEATTERVIVTGSYIPTAETESALPVTVYTAEVLQKQGAQTPIEGLRQLPSFVGNTQTENDSNPGNGQAFINLRAVGPENTLTLINGRRAFEFADVNAIPIGALSRTEVLKDGAGAIYGSDAVAGVVNFILLNGPGEKPYEGAEIKALYGNTTDTDAHVRTVYVKGGVTGLDGKVAIAASGEYYSRANLFSRDRPDVSRSGDASNNPGDPFYPDSAGMQWGGVNANSPTFSGRISVATSIGLDQFGHPLISNLVLISPFTVDPRGAYRLFDRDNVSPVDPVTGQAQALAGTDPSRFNFRAYTPAIPAMEKAMYYVTGRYKIFGDGLQLYGDVMYSKVKQDNGLAASPFLMSTAVGVGTAGINEIRASNFNPFANNITSLRYRMVQETLESGLSGRRSFFDRDYHRFVAGINGDFNIKDNGFISRFGYDSGFVYENLFQRETDSGDYRRSYLRALIAPPVPGGFQNPGAPLPTVFNGAVNNAGTFNPFIGQWAPTSGTAPIYNNTNSAAPQFRTGVPIGIGAYNNDIANLNWTNGGAAYIGNILFKERDFLYDAKINAHLFPGLWNGGIDFALGYEHREVQVHNIPDPVQASADPLGFNSSPDQTKTKTKVDSVFFEFGIPIVTSTMNIPGIRSLDLTIAWRYEKFDLEDQAPLDPTKAFGSFDNVNDNENFGGAPRVSLRYQPIADITLRAGWGQSFRSPGAAELFQPASQGFPQLFDPVNGVVLQPPSGVIGTGNSAAFAEKTDSYSAGIVWTPKFLPGFTMTADWYQLFTRDLVLSSDNEAQVLLTQGTLAPIQRDPGGDVFCDSSIDPATNIGIVRDDNGDLQCIFSQVQNAGKRLVQGLDVTAVYELPTERFGKFTFSGGWNHFFTWKAEAGIDNSFLGNYNNGSLPLAPGAIPWNKGFLRTEWEWRHFDFVATGNYIGDFRDDVSFNGGADPNIGQPDYTGRIRTVPSYITLDMQLSYEFVKPAAEPMPTAKDSKDSKNVMQTAADNSSIWQRMLWGTTLTVGVNNAFDRYPPSVIGAFNDNYDTSLYTIRNRFWYASLQKKF